MLFAPVARLAPFTVMVATPELKITEPSVVVPTMNETLPAGWALADAALTIAVSTVEAVDAMDVGFAVTDMVVAGNGEVTVIVVVALEVAKLPVATKLAESVLPPTANEAPFTVNVATPPDSAAEPSDVLPAANETLPVGGVLPV